MSRREAGAALPLDLRLVRRDPLPGLGGEALSVVDEQESTLFSVGFVDGLLAWIYAEGDPAVVGTRLGVGLGSSLAFAEKTLGKSSPETLPAPLGELQRFDKLPGVVVKLGAGEKRPLAALLVFDRALLPGGALSLRGVMLPESRIAFAQDGRYHETLVQAKNQLPAVGAMLEGEGTRQEDGSISLQKTFALNPFAKDLPGALAAKLPGDADLLAFAALQADRAQLTSYSVEPWPGDTADTALLVLSRPGGEGFSRVRLLGPDGPLEILPPRFGVSRDEFLSSF